MYDMIALALQTDSTRTVTFQLSGMNVVPSNIPGVNQRLAQSLAPRQGPSQDRRAALIEEAEFSAFGEFLTRLKSVDENGQLPAGPHCDTLRVQPRERQQPRLA